MKKSIIIFLILFLPIISAVTIDMKEEFNQGETFMAKVSGNFYESITKEDIFFYERHVRQPMSPFITKINNDFYIYAQLLGKLPNNYSIVLKNVKYISGGVVVEKDFTKYFLVSNNTAEFSINPGFVVTNEDFFIEVENLQDSEITIDVVASLIVLETTEPITLGAGTKKIYFSVENSTFELIKLSTENLQYEIPISVFGVSGGDPECVANNSCLNSTCIGSTCTDDCENVYEGVKVCVENETCENIGICKMSCDEDSQDIGKLDCGFFSTCCQEGTDEQKSFNFEQSELDIIMPTNSHTTREIYLYNTGNKTIENILLTISGDLKNYISLSINKIEELKPDSNIKIELEFYSFDKAVEVQGKLTAKAGILTSSEISLDVIRDYIPLDEYEYSPSNQIKTCAELNGEVCALDETCDTDYVYAKDDKCCLGTCGGEESASSSGKIIGWAIVGIVIIFLIWFFKTKYKGAKKEVDLFKIGSGE